MISIKYKLIIYWSESDSAFIVEVAELPGCMADGQTYNKNFLKSKYAIFRYLS
jgi:predicted RNase H-like HicB family nuclease